MTTRTKIPNTSAHTKAMLESILRPHSLEELHALVGSFPFKAVKVVNAQKKSDVALVIPVGEVVELVGLSCQYSDCFEASPGRNVVNYAKQWRLAE